MNESSATKKECDPFTMVKNELLNDADLSLSAKGLYAFMRSKPDNWNFTIRSMSKQLKEGQTAIGNFLKELRSFGWITHKKNQDGTGVYYIHNNPETTQQEIDGNSANTGNPNQGLCNMQKPNRISKTDLFSKTDSSNSMSDKPDDTSATAKQTIEYLNSKVGRNYRLSTANLELVTARLKDGATLADLKKVIDVKSAQWLDDKTMNQYLRPTTLFNRTKFEQYVAETPNKSRDDEFGMML